VLPDERTHAGALLAGPVRAPTWADPAPPPVDFFAVKGIVEALGRALRVSLTFEPGGQPFLHPVRAARVLAAGEEAGWVGEIHPTTAARWDLEAAAAFEVDLAVLAAHATTVPGYTDLTSFPAVRQDLAVIVPQDVSAASVLRAVREGGGALLEHAEIFDVYRGEQVGEGRVSLALRLAFRAPDRTLTDDEVATRRDKIMTVIKVLGGELRA
jgi:phenylalanyl-tRNA synthetase beta chain